MSEIDVANQNLLLNPIVDSEPEEEEVVPMEEDIAEKAVKERAAQERILRYTVVQ